jgi:hypothetical protein
MADQTDQEENQKNYEQDLGDACRCKCNHSEPEQSRDKRNQQKSQSIIEHGCLLFWIRENLLGENASSIVTLPQPGMDCPA